MLRTAEEVYVAIKQLTDTRINNCDITGAKDRIKSAIQAVNSKFTEIQQLNVDEIDINNRHALSQYVDLHAYLETFRQYKTELDNAIYSMPIEPPTTHHFYSLWDHIKENHSFSGITISRSHITIHEIRAVIQEADPSTRTIFKVDLGKFNVKIVFGTADVTRTGLSTNSTLSGAVAEPCGENNPRTIDGRNCYHPHISGDGRLCLGSYVEDLREDIRRLNFTSIIQCICRLINRYNANSLMYPGAYITNWVGDKCICCGGFIGDSGVKCKKTGSPMHKECSVKIGDDYYYPVIIKTCSKCNTLCTPDNYTAINLRTHICNNCPLE